MCGIFGQVNERGANPTLVERMAQRTAHRGPDGYGIWQDGRVALGAGRLAIIDLSAGVQPVFSEDRQTVVAFNGEIYNHRVLRAELEREGHHFYTQTDTEVIVHGYEQWGVGCIARLEGMFGVAIWDNLRHQLLLARDRLGEKPVYYAHSTEGFLFASEIKAILECPQVPRVVNQTALYHLMTVGYTPPPLTLFEGIEKLAPAELLILNAEGLHKQRYWQAQMNPSSTDMSYGDAVRAVRDALTQAVHSRMMSDVPIGAFLSGGVDSTAVVGLMSQATAAPVRTFTVGFDFEGDARNNDKFNVDTRFGELAARHFKTEHHLIKVNPDSTLAEIFPYLVAQLDEPIVQHAIVQTAYVSALARVNDVPVLLTGDAGDELFGGYNHYRADYQLSQYLAIPRPLRTHLLNPVLKRLPSEELRKLARKSQHAQEPVHRYLEWMRINSIESLDGLMTTPRASERAYATVRDALLPLLNQPHTPHFADRIAFTSLNRWVAEDSNMRVDKMSMLMSIEARAPFEDHRLVELAYRLPLRYKLRERDFKRVLKDAVRDLVPADILNRPKWGFVPPSSEWLRTGLRPLLEKVLAPAYVEAVGIFQPLAVQTLVEEHLSKRGYHLWSLWSLLVFHLWHAIYIDQTLKLAGNLSPQQLVDTAQITVESFH